jgi:CYTH domain-containing protein
VGVEIERKYLLKDDSWRELADPIDYSQGYLVADGERTVRVRVAGNEGFITIKGKSKGLSRKEFEYPVPVEDAHDLFSLCINHIVEKRRSKIKWEGKIWEIDEFIADNEGLVLAEIELESEDESFILPPWIGEEVTGDFRYYNSYLSLHPYPEWRINSR